MDQFDDNDNIIELIDDDGNPVMFEFIHALEKDGVDYVVLIPQDDEDEDTDETGVVILRVVAEEDGGESYENIDDETLLEELFGMFISEMEELESEDGDDD